MMKFTFCSECDEGMIFKENGIHNCECTRKFYIGKTFEKSEIPEKFYKYLEELEETTIFNSLEMLEIKSGDRIKPKNTNKELVKSLARPEVLEGLIRSQSRVILKGSCGSGKTQLVVSSTLEMLKNFDLYVPNPKTKKVFYLYSRDIGNFMFNDKKKEEVLRKVKESEILIIDDLGTEQYTTEQILTTLDEVVRNHNGLILITTNIEGELQDFYKSKNTRLSDVLFPCREAEHNEYNCFYYYLGRKQGDSRRKVKTGFSLL